MVKNPAVNAGDMGAIPWSGRSPEKEMTVQYSCLGNPKARSTWKAKVHGVTKGQAQFNN